MTSKSDYHWIDWLLVTAFALTVSIIVILIASGLAWNILIMREFSFWLNILTPTLAVAASSVAIYSFVSYLQTKEIRNLMLVMIAFNIILWAFIFLPTHPASIDWSPFLAERNRNRTIMVLLGVTFPPSTIFGLLSKRTKTTTLSTSALVLWGVILMPLIYIWSFLSPDASFLITSPEGGVQGLTTLGWSATIFIATTSIIAIVGYINQWRSTRNSIDLAIILALLLWFVGVVVAVILWNPLQIAELIWYSCIICGFFLISAAQIISSVVQPFHDLEVIVEKRTTELEQSQLESEFYLNMWTHKMGNLLQGMVTYLELLEYAKQNSREDQETRSAAGKLSREAKLVNHQVLQLMRVKERYHLELDQVELSNSITRSISTILTFIDPNSITFDYAPERNYFIKADDLLELLFLSLIIHMVKGRIDVGLNISISIEPASEVLEVSIRSRGKKHSQDVQEFLDCADVPEDITIDLELYTTRLMMKRYGGLITHHYDSSNEMNSYILRFRT